MEQAPGIRVDNQFLKLVEEKISDDDNDMAYAEGNKVFLENWPVIQSCAKHIVETVDDVFKTLKSDSVTKHLTRYTVGVKTITIEVRNQKSRTLFIREGLYKTFVGEYQKDLKELLPEQKELFKVLATLTKIKILTDYPDLPFFLAQMEKLTPKTWINNLLYKTVIHMQASNIRFT